MDSLEQQDNPLELISIGAIFYFPGYFAFSVEALITRMGEHPTLLLQVLDTSALVIGMLIMFVGFVKYLRAGSQKR